MGRGLPEGRAAEATASTENDLAPHRDPTAEELGWIDLPELSFPGTATKNYQFAKSHGFHDLTHEYRTHHVENFDQVDSRVLVHSWLKYPTWLCHGHRLYRALYPLRHAEP